MESLASIRLFADVARTESFSETAKVLGIATSSVTRQINGLEQSLGIRLFNRSTRKISLTDAGQLYLEHAGRIIADVEDARRAVSELEAMPRGTLRVSAPVVYGRLHIAPSLSEFLTLYPELRLELSLNDQMADLIEDHIDVAVRIAQLRDSSLVARKLHPSTRLILGSPDYLHRHGAPATPEDLKQHNCLTFRLNVANETWRAGASNWRLQAPPPGGEITEVAVKGRFETNNADALLQTALDGLGLILVPSWVGSKQIDDGCLQVVLPRYTAGISESAPAVYAVYSSSRYLSPKVRAFIDFYAEKLRGLD